MLHSGIFGDDTGIVFDTPYKQMMKYIKRNKDKFKMQAYQQVSGEK
jgi:hypothetical protein